MKPQRPHLLICNLAISKSFIKTTPECVAGGAIISANVDFRICIYLKCKVANHFLSLLLRSFRFTVLKVLLF